MAVARTLARRTLLGGLAALALPFPARGEADFLADRTLRLLVASSAGGGGDQAARLFARHLERRLPSTRVAVELMSRANGRLAALEVWEAAPDGLTLGFLKSNLIYATLLGQEELPFDLLRFDWLGSLTRDRRLLVVSERSGIASVATLRERREPLLQAAIASTSGHVIDALLLNAALGVRIKPVLGYAGAQRITAFLAGETDCMLGTYEAVKPLLESGSARLLLRLNDAPVPAPYPEAPVLADHLPAEHVWVATLIQAQCQLGRGLAAPPGMPPARLERLRALFAEISADPEFVAAATDIGLQLEPTPGADLVPLLRSLSEEHAQLAPDFRALVACGQQLADGAGGC